MPRKRPTTEAEWEAKRAHDRARYHANPQAQYEASKRWKNKNRDTINAKRKAKRRAHRIANPIPKRNKQTPEETRAKRKAYYEKNREILCAKQRVRNEADKHERNSRRREERSKNCEKHNEESRQYKKSNPDKVCAYNAHRRAKKKAQTHPMSDKNKISIIYKEARSISKSSGVMHHVDHIIPLESGGWHHEDNLQPLPEKINGASDKGEDPFWVSPSIQYKDWRDVPRHLWPVDLVEKYEEMINMNKGKSIRWDSVAA